MHLTDHPNGQSNDKDIGNKLKDGIQRNRVMVYERGVNLVLLGEAGPCIHQNKPYWKYQKEGTVPANREPFSDRIMGIEDAPNKEE